MNLIDLVEIQGVLNLRKLRKKEWNADDADEQD